MASKNNWSRLRRSDFPKLVRFAKDFYPNFNIMPISLICKVFETYKNTTLVYRDNRNKVRGFVIYQEWPDCLNFIMICLPFYKERETLRIILKGRPLIPKKKIVWFDEEKMEGRGLCHK